MGERKRIPLIKRNVVSRSGRERTLPPVHPSAALSIAYQKKIDRLIGEMHRSLIYWLKAVYRKSPPILAQDATNSATALRREFQGLGKRWLSRFDKGAPELAKYFATAARDRVDGALAKHLRDAGISVEFQVSPAMREVFEATLQENVSLIKSIAEQHLTQVAGAVYHSVMAGRDVGALTRELEDRFGVTRRRAALIARTQNGMATATMNMVRQRELGITKALWIHSSAGRHPRPEHVAANNKEYEVAKGMWLEERWTWPGREINCRCVSRSIIPALQPKS